MDKLVVILWGLLLMYGCDGARRVNLGDRLNAWRDKRMMQRSVGEERSTPNNESPEHLLGLGKDEKLTAKDEVFNKAGHLQVKFQETYKGLPITGETVVLELDEHGEYTGVYGRVVEGLEDDIPTVEPLLTKQDVISIAVDHHNDSINDIHLDQDKDVKLEIYLEKIGEEFQGTLAYRVSYIVQHSNKLSQPVYIIDANQGTVIDNWEGLSTKPYPRQSDYESVKGVGGNTRTGKHHYDGTGKYPLLKVKKTADGKCKLENEHVKVVHANWTDEFYSLLFLHNHAHEFDCSEGNLDKVNGAYSPLNDVYFFSNLVTEMYLDWFGQSPFQRKITAHVHFGEDMANAFYYMNTITFGDGNWEGLRKSHPFTVLDVVSHEIGHGVVERYSGLQYHKQSGGINEAFADIAGVAAEYYLDYTNYEIGSKLYSCGSMRYMYDPKLDKKSIGNARMFCSDLNVHYSSGVFNKAFYLLANTDGWNVKSAFAVFYMANRLYWHEDSDFNDAACGVVKATRDAGKSADDVIKAFDQVGVEPCVESEKESVDLGAAINQTLIFSLNYTEPSTLLAIVGRDEVAVKLVAKDGSIQQQRSIVETGLAEIELNACAAASASEFHVSSYVKGRPFKHFALLSYTNDEIIWLGKNISMADSGELHPDNVTYNIRFEIPEDLTQNTEQAVKMMLIVRMLSMPDHLPIFRMNYGKLPDDDKLWYDYYGSSNYYYAFFNFCHPKPGTYYLIQLRGDTSTLLDIFYVPIEFVNQYTVGTQ
eukprot:GHVU01225015.1.p1 GENE.GHVU01225015.1~~GHVU01225015.1.p1  ORF type:complete len:760 (-),score=82.44 GHVU01225015.1:402-2681(-)